MDTKLIEFFFPAGLLDFFELETVESKDDQLIIYLKEKDIAPEGYNRTDLESKGFNEGGTITDFPIRGKRCICKIKRRKWQIKNDHRIISRDWNIVAKGTRITTEFALFLKGFNR